MVTQVTDGIKISVKTSYRNEYSDPEKNNYLFSYFISIENISSHTVKLLRRHWWIFDSNGEHREVEGEGVVGLQPVLKPGEVHEYESACNLSTDMGKMHGNYQMQRVDEGSLFTVNIPEFELITNYKLN